MSRFAKARWPGVLNYVVIRINCGPAVPSITPDSAIQWVEADRESKEYGFWRGNNTEAVFKQQKFRPESYIFTDRWLTLAKRI
jgi:hypothetical protein